MVWFQFDANLADMQFLYVDLVITTSVAVLSKYTASHGHLELIVRPFYGLFELTFHHNCSLK